MADRPKGIHSEEESKFVTLLHPCNKLLYIDEHYVCKVLHNNYVKIKNFKRNGD